LDPGTIRLLESLGVNRASSCAEIGAGAGSIALWLAERAGRVVATDLDTRFLETLWRDRLEVRRHDILTGPLADGPYDVIHTRLLLMHLRERGLALRHMVASLRPGGWLLAEEYDLCTAGLFQPPSELQARVNEAIQRLFERSGGDPRYGIKLLGDLQRAGLADVEAEARLRVVPLGSPLAETLALKLEQFRQGLLEHGLLSDDELQRAIQEVRTPGDGAVHYPALLVAAWGRRPA